MSLLKERRTVRSGQQVRPSVFWLCMFLIVLATAFTAASLPAQAQSDNFFSELRKNLGVTPGSESALTEPAQIHLAPKPALGASEVLEGASAPKSATETYGAYDAGKEHINGAVAASAAILAVLAVVFIFALVLTNSHDGKE